MTKVNVGIRAFEGSNEGGNMAAGWAAALEKRGHEVRWIDVYEPNALQAVSECDVFFCTVSQDSPKDLRYLSLFLEAVSRVGCLVYPDYDSRWYFDDKVAQAWLFRALDIPTPETWVFFDRRRALGFIQSARFPLVFKLAGGAGSQNVRLIGGQREAAKVIRKMFGSGISRYRFAPRLKKAVKRNPLFSLSWAHIPRFWFLLNRLIASSFDRTNRDRGYILLQEFMPNNDCDHRVAVIGDRAFVYRRGVRDNDFRASGSERNVYLERREIDTRMVELAFRVRDKLKGSSIAMDFVLDPMTDSYKLLEVSPSFVSDFVALCKGYFKSDLSWVSGSVSPQECMVADVMEKLKA